MIYVDDNSEVSEMRGSNQHSAEMSIMIIMGIIQKQILVGGFNPSQKYESQLGWFFPTEWKHKSHVPNHQSEYKWIGWRVSTGMSWAYHGHTSGISRGKAYHGSISWDIPWTYLRQYGNITNNQWSDFPWTIYRKLYVHYFYLKLMGGPVDFPFSRIWGRNQRCFGKEFWLTFCCQLFDLLFWFSINRGLGASKNGGGTIQTWLDRFETHGLRVITWAPPQFWEIPS